MGAGHGGGRETHFPLVERSGRRKRLDIIGRHLPANDNCPSDALLRYEARIFHFRTLCCSLAFVISQQQAEIEALKSAASPEGGAR